TTYVAAGQGWCVASWATHHRWCPLLELDGGARCLELGLRLLGVFLGNLFQDGLRGAVDQVLGLLQPQAGEAPDLLDDLDLLVAGGGEDDVELVLLLGGLGRRGAATAGDGGDRHGRGGGDAEFLFEGLQKVVELEDGHVLEDVEELGGARHGSQASCSGSVGVSAGAAGSAGSAGAASGSAAAASADASGASAAGASGACASAASAAGASAASAAGASGASGAGMSAAASASGSESSGGGASPSATSL